MTSTSDLIIRMIVSGAYLLYYFRSEFQIKCVNESCDSESHVPFSGHCDLDLDLWPSFNN